MRSHTHKHSFLACAFLAQFSYIYHVQISMRKHCIVLRVAEQAWLWSLLFALLVKAYVCNVTT